ncbi:MAG TPA: GatB/YqeY domain-containing protein [Acidobacteriota bacterium]|nr:GatB/YqeY domain-containing protein [Acidobacteriota bacterium]
MSETLDLTAKIKSDLKAAMLAKDELRRTTLRSVITAITNAEKSRPDALSENDVLQLINKEAKKRREAVEQYRKGGRDDLADREEAEYAVLQSYLPQQLSREEIEAVVQPVIDELGASGPQQMGQVMGKVMPKLQGKADGKMVNAVVRELLSK